MDTRTMKFSETTLTAATSNYLKPNFQVGSIKSDRINYDHSQKVFHRGDIPRRVRDAKLAVQKSKEPNILEAQRRDWNQSVALKQKQPTDSDLQRQLRCIRAGLFDQTDITKKGGRPKAEVNDLIRHIVSFTNKGPIGFLTKKWFDPEHEKAVMNHSVKPWKSWNESTSTCTPEDIKQKNSVFATRERRRIEQNIPDEFLSVHYGPMQLLHEFTQCLREKKVEFADIRDQFKRELRAEYPDASDERLQAFAQRLLDEKLRSDEKLARFPVQHESFRPNLALTTVDRRYKEYSHKGTWSFNAIEEKPVWSCCLNEDENSRGCEGRIYNPDSWCTLNM